MTEYVQPIIDFIALRPYLALLLAFLIAMGEALFVIGLFVPSTVVLVGIGGLVGIGRLEFMPVFLATAFGAAVGDNLSYAIGHHFKDRLFGLWPFSRYQSLVEAGKYYFAAHGGKSIVIGRFIPGIKAVVPGVAGMLGMNFWKFTTLNVLSAFVWAAAHLLPGMSAGWAIAGLGLVSKRLGILAGVLIVGAIVAFFALRFVLTRLARALPRWRVSLYAWAAGREDWLAHIVVRLVGPEHADLRILAALSLMLASVVCGFMLLLTEVVTRARIVYLDTAVNQFLQSLRTTWTDKLMVAVTMLGDGVVVTVVVVVLSVVLLLSRQYRLALGLVIAMISTALFVPLIKLIVHVQRPIDLYTGSSAFSFPSGHATLSAVLYGLLALIVWRGAGRWLGRGVVMVCIALVVMIGFSRIYLAAHWPSDVLAGLLFGVGLVAAFALISRLDPVPPIVARELVVAGALTLLLFGGWHLGRGYAEALAGYAPQQPPPLQLHGEWRVDGWRDLPPRRIDLAGELEEPFLLQWRGGLAELHAALSPDHWQRAPAWSVAALNAFALADTPAVELPVIPQLHNGRAPALTLVKPDEQTPTTERFVLRAWGADVVWPAQGLQRVYLVSIVAETIAHPFHQISIARRPDDKPCSPRRWFKDLTDRQQVGPYLTADEGGCSGRLTLAEP